jgi:ArsR family metal-binding transcriptional regulator
MGDPEKCPDCKRPCGPVNMVEYVRGTATNCGDSGEPECLRFAIAAANKRAEDAEALLKRIRATADAAEDDGMD